MKTLLILVLLLSACGTLPDNGDTTTVNVSTGDASNAGDPITEGDCKESDDGCQQQQ